MEGEQDEAGGRRDERVRILPADRLAERSGGEPADVADAGNVADQQALDEQQPGADADERRHLVAHDGADTDADRRPQRGRGGAAGEQERVVATVELYVDPACAQRPGADRGGERGADEPERGADQRARPHLRRNDAFTPRRDEQRRADRPVAELARDRQRAEQRGEQRAEELSTAEHHQLLGAAVEVPRGDEAVQQYRERDEAEHRGEQTEGGPAGALFEQLGAKLGFHRAPPVSSRKTSSSVRPSPVNWSSGPPAIRRPRSMIRTWSTVSAASASMWLETSTVRPRSAKRRKKRRSQCTPAGSSPVAGSSRMSSSGSPSSAPASPSRPRIPSE